MTNLQIKPVQSDNWREVAALEAHNTQKTVIESNERSLLEAIYDTEHNWTCYGLYKNGQAAGFMMIGAENVQERYIWLDRFMIDRHFQGQGLGSSFLTLAIAFILDNHSAEEIVLSVTPENISAKRFYEKHGFHNTGLVDPANGEEIFSYKPSLGDDSPAQNA